MKKGRYKLLHRHLDELLADYIKQNPKKVLVLYRMPLIDFMEWAYQQTIKPTEEKC